MARVYLAGPITGLSYGDSVDWREKAKSVLAEAGIVGLNPMRGKDYLEHEESVGDTYNGVSFDHHPIGHLAGIISGDRGITTRDRWDCHRCDLVLVNFLGAKKVSIGTVMEIAWADSSRIPAIVVMEKEGNPHDHSMIRECIGFRVETLEDGLHIAKAMLSS